MVMPNFDKLKEDLDKAVEDRDVKDVLSVLQVVSLAAGPDPKTLLYVNCAMGSLSANYRKWDEIREEARDAINMCRAAVRGERADGCISYDDDTGLERMRVRCEQAKELLGSTYAGTLHDHPKESVEALKGVVEYAQDMINLVKRADLLPDEDFNDF